MGKLYIMRHAIAEERDDFAETGLPDDERPLTEKGLHRLQKVSQKLAHLNLDISLIAQSPLTRSQQTAEVLRGYLSKPTIETVESLRPDSSFSRLAKDLSAFVADENEINMLVIGHEDHLSQFTSYLLTGETQPFLVYKKAGIACLEYDGTISAKNVRLEWLLTPKVILGL